MSSHLGPFRWEVLLIPIAPILTFPLDGGRDIDKEGTRAAPAMCREIQGSPERWGDF